jgi:hypothetical protein
MHMPVLGRDEQSIAPVSFPSLVDVGAELHDDAPHNIHMPMLSRYEHRTDTVCLRFLHVGAELHDDAPHDSIVSIGGRSEQGSGTVSHCLVDVGSELFYDTPQQMQKPQLSRNDQGSGPIELPCLVDVSS